MRTLEWAETEKIMDRIRSDDMDCRIGAAWEIRQLVRTSPENRRILSGAVEPLVSMLRSDDIECNQAAILALLNLAVKDEGNKIKIVEAGGAVDRLLIFLQSSNQTLQEYSTGALFTLSACAINKQIISASGAIPLLIRSLCDGTTQAKADAAAALYNLSDLPSNLTAMVSYHVLPPLIAYLKTCKKSSKTAEKCTALLESLVSLDEARDSLVSEPGGVLAIVELLEEGSVLSRQNAVGVLLTMCECDRNKYREIILREGVIPGLLELTVHGTPKARSRARELLKLLRNSPLPRPEVEPDALENIICDIVSKVDGDDRMGKARKMLTEMVQLSMEQSLRHLQQRASW